MNIELIDDGDVYPSLSMQDQLIARENDAPVDENRRLRSALLLAELERAVVEAAARGSDGGVELRWCQ